MPAKPKKPTKTTITAANAVLAAAADPGPTPGAVWSNNHDACNKTWWWLAFLNQLNAAFPAAGQIRMDALAFWNKLPSAEQREDEAGALADMLIKGFTQVDGATYEDGSNYASAKIAMTKVLTDATKTVSEFAAVNDEIFHFFMES